MKKLKTLLMSILFLFGILSCRINDLPSVEELGTSIKIDKEYLDYDLKKSHFRPNWKSAYEGINNSLEVPIISNAKSAKISIKAIGDQPGKAILLFFKVNEKPVVQEVFFIPNDKFGGDIEKITTENHVSEKFSGTLLYKDVESDLVNIRSVFEGNVVTRLEGLEEATDEKASNGRLRSCEWWGTYRIHYNEYGEEVYSELLSVYQVCTSDGPPSNNTDQPGPPDGGGISMNYVPQAGDQLIFDIQKWFAWLGMSPITTHNMLYNSLQGCNIHGLLPSPIGDPLLMTSWNPRTSVVGYCPYGYLTSPGAQIWDVTPNGPPSTAVKILTFHDGTISVNIQGAVSVGPTGSYGGVVVYNGAFGRQLAWQR